MNKWILTKDKLPEDGEYVLVYNFTDANNDSKGLNCATLIKEFSEEHGNLNRWHIENSRVYVYEEWNEVTHWMPLPEPPHE